MWTCHRKLSISVCVTVGLISGCKNGATSHPYTAEHRDSANRGRAAIIAYRCGDCHTIPGVSSAKGVFGPPLNSLSRRTYIGGNFPNTMDNLVGWVMSPQTMKPGTAMPVLGLSEPQARDIATYLDTLK